MSFITNKKDRKNLSFLLSSSDNVLDAWLSTAGDDDIVYAQELLSSYMKEIDLIAMEKTIEQKLSMDNKFVEANEIIHRISKK